MPDSLNWNLSYEWQPPKPPSDEGGGFAVGEDGGRENMDISCYLSPSHAVRVTAPSSEGAFKAVL